MIALLLCSGSVCAEDQDLFRDIILARDGDCPSFAIVLNDELVLSIPETWSEVPQEDEDGVCFQYQDSTADIAVYAGWVLNDEFNYEELAEDLKAVSNVSCAARKNSFEWFAGNTSEGIAVIHEGKNSHIYLILFLIDIKNDNAYERVVHDCGYILHSFNRLENIVEFHEADQPGAGQV